MNFKLELKAKIGLCPFSDLVQQRNCRPQDTQLSLLDNRRRGGGLTHGPLPPWSTLSGR